MKKHSLSAILPACILCALLISTNLASDPVDPIKSGTLAGNKAGNRRPFTY